MPHGSREPVLFVTFSGREGGPQAWFAQLVRQPALNRAVAIHAWYAEDRYRRLVGKIRLVRDCRARFRAAGRPRIVYLSLDLDFAAQVALAMRLVARPMIVVHSHASRYGEESSLRLRFYRWLVRRLADRRAAVSEQAAFGMFGQGLDRVRLVPAFVDFDALIDAAAQPDPSWTKSLRQSCEHDFVFACVGRYAESKNLSTAIRALAGMDAGVSAPAARLLLIGAGPLESTLRRLAVELGVVDRVHFTGWVDNIGWYYRKAVDCLLMPSEHEAAPRAVLEAQAFGCRVIVSDAVPDFCLFREELAVRVRSMEVAAWRCAMADAAREGKKSSDSSHAGAATMHPLFSAGAGVASVLELLRPERAGA